MAQTQIISRAAINVKIWGRFAARRYIERQLGYNEATARRILTIALQCEAVVF
jgi:hypothetical protein